MVDDADEHRSTIRIMRISGVDQLTARFMLALNQGTLTGDTIEEQPGRAREGAARRAPLLRTGNGFVGRVARLVTRGCRIDHGD